MIAGPPKHPTRSCEFSEQDTASSIRATKIQTHVKYSGISCPTSKRILRKAFMTIAFADTIIACNSFYSPIPYALFRQSNRCNVSRKRPYCLLLTMHRSKPIDSYIQISEPRRLRTCRIHRPNTITMSCRNYFVPGTAGNLEAFLEAVDEAIVKHGYDKKNHEKLAGQSRVSPISPREGHRNLQQRLKPPSPGTGSRQER
jgi:hypothetical protein